MKSGLFVVTGGPGTGKTTTVEHLKQSGYYAIPEASRTVSGTDPRFKGQSISELDQKLFQEALINYHKKQLSKDYSNKVVFSDRGLVDTIAYYKVHSLPIPDDDWKMAKTFLYDGVFLLDLLEEYCIDKFRTESPEEQIRIHRLIRETYEELGYKPMIVPCLSVEERTNWILERL